MLKSLIRKFFRRVGYDLVRYLPQPERPVDVVLLAIASRIGQGNSCDFLQIGANDGFHNDPIRESVIRFGLSGILVEPLPDVFKKLQASYRTQPRLIFENCAVGEKDGEATLYRFRCDAPVPEVAHELASFRREHLLKPQFRVRDAERHIEAITVPTCTIATLLARHSRLHIELLQIDTEGFDFEVIKLAFVAGLKPAIIHFENTHLSRGDLEACARLLEANRYRFLHLGFDTLAVRDDAVG